MRALMILSGFVLVVYGGCFDKPVGLLAGMFLMSLAAILEERK